jgi:hypothetical protein
MARKKAEEIELVECAYPLLKKELCGHSTVLGILEKALSNETFPSTVLISGPPRVGKTSLAFVLSAALECERPSPWACGECSPCKKIRRNLFPDLRIISLEESDTGKLKSQILVEQVRKQVLDVVELPPYEGKKLVFIIEPAEALNISSQNSLLKVLEEPPSYAHFILVAKDFGPLLPTVRSRCQEIHLTEVGDPEMEELAAETGIKDRKREALEVSRGRPGVLISGEWEDFLDLRNAIEQLLFLGSSYKHYMKMSPMFDVLLEYPPIVVLDETAYVIKEILRNDVENTKRSPIYTKIVEQNGREGLYKKTKAIMETPPLLARNVQPKLLYQTIFLDFGMKSGND